MSDNEDLLGDDLGDHSLADYNLGNEEEEQLLADDYESGASQNVPTSVSSYSGGDMVATEYSHHEIQYSNQPIQYQMTPEPECVVPNILVEVPGTLPEHSTYAPYEPPVYEIEHAVVPPAIPSSPLESPQIVPSEMTPPIANGDMVVRERFVSERPHGAQRLPQVRDIPDSLDKVVLPRGGWGGGGGAMRGRTSWRSPQFTARYQQYRRHHRANFNQRPQFPPPQIRPHRPQMRPDIRPNPPQMRPELRPNPPQMRPEIRPNPPQIRPDIRLNLRTDLRPDIRPDIRPNRPELRPNRPELRPDGNPELHPEIHLEIHQLRPNIPPEIGPDISPERPILPNLQEFPPMEPIRPFQNLRFPFRPNMEEPNFGPMRPHFERPMFFQRPMFEPRPFGPVREVGPNVNHIPQVTIRHAMPMPPVPKPLGREPEVRMLPVQLPPNLPPRGLAGKKVLINPHFKGNFQPPVEGLPLPTYIPTKIQKSPPLSPPLESKFGPISDIDDAAERFIVEQRNALARAAGRKFPRRSPQRFIENTTIEIENELARPAARSDDDDLLRRQEEFINANRAGLRRRMRSPSPVPPARRSVSPRRSPERTRPRLDPNRPPPNDEDMEYRRRVREQESLRERVLRAKEARRRKHAVAMHRGERERDRLEREKAPPKPVEPKAEPETTSEAPAPAPDTTRKSPEKQEKPVKVEKVEKIEAVERDRSPVKKEEIAEVNSTCDTLTPPREPPAPALPRSPERALTPPLPRRETRLETKLDSDDDLDLILDDIDGILSDDDDNDRYRERPRRPEPPKPKPAPVDLRAKLPAKPAETKRPPRQKIVFHDKEKEEQKKKGQEKSPPKRPAVSSSTKAVDTANVGKKASKTKAKSEIDDSKSRPRIIFDHKEPDPKEDAKPQFPNRRVILQRKITQNPKDKSVFARIEVKNDPTKPNPGIFSRAVRTAIGSDPNRIVIKKDEPQIEYGTDSDIDEDKLLEEEIGNVADVKNLPHGMTDTRLKTLAGNDVQSLILDKEERSAKITFKTTIAAEVFKKKFNNKMVAASRLTVSLR